MDRRSFLLSLAGVLATPLGAAGQQTGKVYRIGFIAGSPPTNPEAARVWEAFLQGLRELGYVEGQNIRIERRYAEGRNERLPDLAADLVRMKVDVIVASATQPVHAASRATTTIPIVMPNHSDPVGSGVAASLKRPGGNITGLSIVNPELTGKRLELLKMVVPQANRIGVFWNPTHRAHPSMLTEAETAAGALGLRLQRVQGRGLEDYESAFSALAKERVQALMVLGDVTFWFHRNRIAELAAKHHLPAVFAQREHVEAGGLMSYGVDLRDNFRRAAVYVDKILKGAKPGELPIEQPTKFELFINLKTAKALGLTVPPSLLLRADQVIE